MKAQTMRRLRQYHLYLGLFFAPAILLFSVSGALQTFRLQQESGWGGATPPYWMIWLAAVHKDQELPTPEPVKHAPKAPPPAAEKARPAPPAPPPPAHIFSPLPLKIFVVLLSLGLTISTAIGIVIALTNRAVRRNGIIMLVAGTVLPLVLLL
ncbi:hypothetical protein [Flavisphingomonas formosensis]|uniref:hypothetical protein n=1 Tax=Flavisphingomonas formosensis TaxID=861534 RepID=UPI0018DF4213|nr:hypothetical protein [Sphingomonas formosensis]